MKEGTIYTKEEILVKIYEGEKVRSVGWIEKYIYLKDFLIMDNAGEKFNLFDADINEWIILEEIEDDTLTKDEALKALFTGAKVKGASWGNKALEFVEGQVLLNGKPFNIMADSEENWIIVKEDSVSTISKDEALKTLFTGAKVKGASWGNKALEFVEGQVLLNGKPFNIMADSEENWIIVKEDKKGEVTPQNASDTAKTLKDVYGVTTPKEIQEQFLGLLNEAKNSLAVEKIVCDYIPYCWIGNKVLGTSTTYYAGMRNTIKKMKNKSFMETALNLYVAPQRAYESVQENISEKKKEQIRTPKVFDIKEIKDTITRVKHRILAGDYSEKPKQTDLERERAYWAFSYLTMVTGRRQTELLKTLEIKKEKDTWVYAGVLKDRQKGKIIEAFSHDEDFEFLSDLLGYLQSHITEELEEKIKSDTMHIKDKKEKKAKEKEFRESYFSESAINKKFNASFNNALKRITNLPYTSSNWRDIYAEMFCIKEKAKGKGSHIDERDIRAKVLGHSYDKNLSATELYDGWIGK